ncbi:ABC transporter substrate-binding protein [Massilia sp. W12]|uniref:ABC transporter substrate-binding protein n=1 Tax=Massilia sp. W12 TaxID=3126507 RepID=UPI0030CFFB62
MAKPLLRLWRRVLATLSLTVLCAAASAENGVSSNTIVLGQSVALTGPLAELGQDTANAARAYFDYVNARGGVHGRKIELISLDDAYDTNKGVANVKSLITEKKVFALFNVMGTGANTAIMPLLNEYEIPSIAPFSGATALRKPINRLVFNLRAGYAEELEKIVDHITMRGLERVAVVYQNNGFGKDGLAGVEAALEKRKLKPTAKATVENDASDAAKAAKELAQSKPQAVVMITAGKPSVEFIKAYNLLETGIPYFTLSVMGTQTSVNALGKHGVGVVVSQVVPFPFSVVSEIVQEYKQVMEEAKISTRSFMSMEGFLNAKLMVEALRRTGRDPSRAKLITALEGMNRVEFGGFLINLSKNRRQASEYVELTVISKDGKFLR